MENREHLATTVSARTAVNLARHLLLVPMDNGVEFFDVQINALEERPETPILVLTLLCEFGNQLGICLESYLSFHRTG